MKFPVIKNVQATTIADQIQGVTPRMDAPKIKESYKDHMGNDVTVYENGGRTIHSYSSTHLFGDYGHSFGHGFFVVDQNGEMVFAGNERYNELFEICMPYWQVLKGLKDRFKGYSVEPSRNNSIAVNDKIIKGIEFFPGMIITLVENSIEEIGNVIQKDIDSGRIKKDQYGAEA
jgi:uncharacterized protein Veg